jgi:Bacterial membrane protein YfhO
MGTVLLVARSLAVYGGTAAALLFLAHRFVLPLPRRTALLLAAAPLLFTGRALLTSSVYGPIDIIYNGYPFGSRRVELAVPHDRTPLLGDVVYLYIPWRAAVREAVAEGRLPLWNRHTLAGEPLAAVVQAAVLHPGTLVGLLLPLPQAWTFDMTLRLLIALLSAFLFMRELRCGERAAWLGAMGFAFSNWMIFYLGSTPTPAAAPLPLLLVGFRRIAREPGTNGAAIAVASLLVITAAGHPETLLHASTGAALFFFWELAGARRGRRVASLRTAVFTVAVAAGLSAVILLPLLEALPHTLEHFVRTTWYVNQPRSRSGEEIVTRLVAQIVPYAVGVSGRGRMLDGFAEPSAYAGAMMFPFALTGLFARIRSRWFFVVAGLVGLAVWAKTAAADAVAKLPLFDIALNERLILWTILSLCVLAALGANRLADGEGLPAFLAGGVGTLGLVAWLNFRFRPRLATLEMPAEFLRGRVLAQLVPLVLAVVLVGVLARRRRATMPSGLTALVVVFAASRVFEQGGTYPTMPRQTFYPRFDVLEAIPEDPAYRMAGVGRALIPNASAVYGLDDVRGYEAMTLHRLHDTYPLWCVAQPVWFNRVDDPARPFLSFLAARWVLTETGFEPPAGWPKRAEGSGLRLLENPRALPIAFAPRYTRSEPDAARRLEVLAGVGDFAERGVVEDGPASDWRPNGPARVAIVEALAGRMEIEVRAEAPTLVATSIPAWPGWKAKIQGAAAPVRIVPYNHAFLAVAVPAGTHRLTLRYLPDGFVYGAAVSAGTLAVSLFVLLRRRRFGSNDASPEARMRAERAG